MDTFWRELFAEGFLFIIQVATTHLQLQFRQIFQLVEFKNICKYHFFK